MYIQEISVIDARTVPEMWPHRRTDQHHMYLVYLGVHEEGIDKKSPKIESNSSESFKEILVLNNAY